AFRGPALAFLIRVTGWAEHAAGHPVVVCGEMLDLLAKGPNTGELTAVGREGILLLRHSSGSRYDIFLGVADPEVESLADCGSGLGRRMVRRLTAGGRNDGVHTQVFHQLAVVVPGVNAILDGNAETSRGPIGPRRDARSGNWTLGVIDRRGRAMHVCERAFQVRDDLGFCFHG